MKKVGAVSGKFRILHNAHKEYIIKATLEVDELHVFIVDDPKIIRYATIKETQIAIGEILKHIDIDYYIHIAPYTLDMLEWDNYVIKTVGHSNITMYNSKEEYTNIKLKTGYINCTHSLSISASEIEKNPYKELNFRNIAREYMPYLNKKIVISGIESCGKTEMAKKISMIFDTEFSREYGRYYADECLGGEDDAYDAIDFEKIAIKQMVQDEKKNRLAKRFLVVDTDPIVTLRFLDAYYQEYKERKILTSGFEKSYQKYRMRLVQICKEYHADLTIILAPNVKFVEDGQRWVVDQNERNKNHQELLRLYKELGKKFIVIDEENYKQRFKNVENKIIELLEK